MTIQQALEAVNSQYDVAPFAWQDARLTAICGANVAPFDLKKIPCVETVDGISIGWDDITKPLAFDKICFGVMDADAFILNDRWAELSRGGQAKVVARLKEDDKNAHVQYLIGILYEGGLGVKQSHVGAVKWLRKFDEVWDARGKSKKPISIREAIKKELGNLFEELGKRVF